MRTRNAMHTQAHSLRKFLIGGTLAAAGLFSGLAQAQTFCVFDPLGASGDFYSMFKDYQLAAKRWNVSIDLKAYTDESAATDAYKAGTCDMVNMTGMRARQFNAFTGTIDAPSVIENYTELHSVLDLMDSPKLAKAMINGNHEVAGVLPIGAGYGFVHDRRINSLSKLVGLKVAVMDWDKSQAMLVQQVGAVPVAADITSFGDKFNQGTVDAIVAPAALYKPMELSKGIGKNGGIVHRPLFQFTMQLMVHRDKFPATFGQQSRDYVAAHLDHAFGLIRNNENAIDQSNWVYAARAENVEYEKIMRPALEKLVQAGMYDTRMLAILKRVRCKTFPDNSECSAATGPAGEQTATAGKVGLGK